MTAPRDASGTGAPEDAEFSHNLSVATHALDTLRAAIEVEGPVNDHTVPLLASVARTHLDAGRRYLRVDLARASVHGSDSVAVLVELHDRVGALGGSLLFEHPDVATARLLNAADLLVGPARDA